MKQLTKTLKQMLNALAYADAGEYLTPRQKVDVLTNSHAAVVKPSPPITMSKSPARPARRRVALYMGAHLPAEVMEYCVQTCSRLNHDLTILTFETHATAERLLRPYQAMLETAGIDMESVTLAGEPLPRLTKYLRRRSDIAFMVCKDAGYLGRSFILGNNSTHALPVPVVVVVTQQEAAAEQSRQTTIEAEQKNRSA